VSLERDGTKTRFKSNDKQHRQSCDGNAAENGSCRTWKDQSTDLIAPSLTPNVVVTAVSARTVKDGDNSITIELRAILHALQSQNPVAC